MKLVIHDLTDAEFRSLVPERPTEWHTVSRTPSSHSCIGCLDCWFHPEGECPIRDNLCEIAELASEADEIIVLSNGRVAEQGTHEELLKKNGIYRKVYDMQTAGLSAGEKTA